MKLLIVTDTHSNISNAKKLKEKFAGSGIDAILACGDFTNEGMKPIAEEIIKELDFARVFAVPGNMDSVEVNSLLNERGIGIHKSKRSFMGYTFIGLGGAKPVNTYYRTNVSELEAEKYLGALSKGEDPEKTILVLHSPPFGSKISLSGSGRDLGLRAAREFIMRFQPKLAACGHVHESAGVIKLGETQCINPGSLKDGLFAFAEIDEKGNLTLRSDKLA